ncbi:unnamed protein product [Arabis nemorensis]|uniref:AAA+ ATPase domain-containing protein n=1 Tax=Arabis nemorensis TaxID=586526 RepID=A0A565ATK2_9BRAS|nr:unnamed protein product [Arabis nemorensis]
MVKRGRSGGVSNRRLVHLVNDSYEKGLKAEEIADEILEDREWARSSRHIVLLNVNKILRSRNFGKNDEEKSNKKKTKPSPRAASPSGSSWSEAFEGNGNVSDDNETQNMKVVGGRSNVRRGGDDEAKTFKDLGGLKEILDDLTVCVKVPLLFPQIHERLGAKPISGILLHGPPGCGKCTLARAIANETNVPFYMVSACEVVSGISGESEENIRNLFSKAYRTAPSIIFIDEIDAIGSKRDNQQKGIETRMEKERRVSSGGDDISGSETSGHVIVIAATNRPEALDPALRRSLRFDKEIYLGVPNEKARAEIFSLITRKCRLEIGFDTARIVRRTSGFVGSDFKLLAMEALNVATKRLLDSRASELLTDIDSLMHHEPCPFPIEVTENIFYTTSDFEEALKKVKPSLAREGFSTTPRQRGKILAVSII